MYSNADIFVCMTQDAVPADKNLIKELAEALEGTPNAAVAYARQLPRTQCREIERYTRSFNYPNQSAVKSIEDIERLGIKTFFARMYVLHITEGYLINSMDLFRGQFLTKI